MKTLLIMRHAKSSWTEDGQADHDRPLNQRGRRDAPRMGQLLRKHSLVPDVVLASDARRAAQTARAVCEAGGCPDEPRLDRRLYNAPAEAYLDVLREVAPQATTVLIVGHNPAVEELLEELTGQSETLPTAAIAQVSLPVDAWHDLPGPVHGELVDLWRPRELH